MVRVLLLEHVPNVGKKWQIVNLKDGFASNFIFPKNLGKKITEADESKLLSDRKKEESKRVELVEKRHEIAEQIRWTQFTYKFKTSWKGKLHGQVSEKDIITSIKKKFGIELTKKNVDMPGGHIKKVGTSDVFVKLGHDTQAKITIIVEEQK